MSKLIASFLFCAAVCSASSITYDVNLTVGNGSVTGQITTDGTIGTIAGRAQITDFDLIIDDSVNTQEITGGQNGNGGVAFFNSSALTATATQLTFDFSPGTSLLLFQFDIDGQGGTFLCFEQDTSCTGLGEGISIGAGSGGDQFSNMQLLSLTGSEVIATAVSAAPEPSTLALIGAGIGFLGFGKFRKK